MTACTFCNGSRWLNDDPAMGRCVCSTGGKRPVGVSMVSAYIPPPPTHQIAYTLPQPAPGVLPTGQSGMAMDDAIAGTWGWANGYNAAFTEGLGFLGYPYLAELSQRPEYRMVVETIAKEATRKWVKLTATGDEDKSDKLAELKEVMDRLKVRDAFRRASVLDGFFGRAHLYVDTGATDKPAELAAPLVRKAWKVKTNPLEAFRPVEPTWTYPNSYNTDNPLRGDYYVPQEWFVMGTTVHRSRLLTFVAREVPDILKPAYQFGGLAMTQMLKPYVDNWIRTRQSVSDITHSFSKSVLATNMEAILTGGGNESVIARAHLFNMLRDNRGLMMVDKDTEEFVDVSTPLNTLDKLQAQALEQIAAIAEIPLVILLGITPSGLNASSDGEIRTFYTRIKSYQEDFFGDNLTDVLELVQLATFGEIDPTIGYEFEPLWEENGVDAATIGKTEADTDAVYIEAGVVAPEEVRSRLASEDGSRYHGLRGPSPDVPEDGEPIENTDPAALGSHTGHTLQEISLNGSQVASMVEIVNQVATGALPRESGVQMLLVAFPLQSSEAEAIMGSVGKGFTPTPEAPEPRGVTPTAKDPTDG